MLLGNGDGTFQAAIALGSGPFGYGLAAADFNHDGHLDLVVTNGNGTTVSVFLGNGDGTFQSPVDYATGSSPGTITVADLNSDGNPDLVVGNSQSASISILFGKSDGTFQPKIDYPTCASPWGVAASDTNSDGFPEVAVACPVSNSIQLFGGSKTGALATPVAIPTVNNYWLAYSDLDGDGVVDLVLPDLLATKVHTAMGMATEAAATTRTAVSIPGGGSHNIEAVYAGDTNSAASTSTSVSLTGSLIATTLSLNVSPASGPGQTFILLATLAPSASSGYVASGAVTFFDGGTAIGLPVALSRGTATLSKSDFAKGTHTITAAYSGDANFLTSTSSAANANVIPDYSIAAHPTSLAIQRGQIGTATLTITPTVGFNGQLMLACSGLPEFTTCAFSPSAISIPGDNVAQTIQLSLHTPASSSSGVSPSLGPPLALALSPALALLLPFGVLAFCSRSSRIRINWLAVTLLFACTLTGCGSSRAVPLGTSTVTVTASTTDGSVHHNTTISVTITQ